MENTIFTRILQYEVRILCLSLTNFLFLLSNHFSFHCFLLWDLRVFSNFWNLRLNRPFVWKIKRILQTFRRFLSFLVQNLECKCEINYSNRMVTNGISDAKLFIIPRYFYRRIEFLNHNLLYELLRICSNHQNNLKNVFDNGIIWKWMERKLWDED